MITILCVFVGFALGWFFCALWIGGRCYSEKLEIDYTVPKPKFNIGNEVYNTWLGKSFEVQNCVYSVVMKKWYYYDGGKSFNKNSHAEDNLKGVKNGESE